VDLKTSNEWAKIFSEDFKIIDADGWPRGSWSFDHEFYFIKITREEFLRRAYNSTLKFLK